MTLAGMMLNAGQITSSVAIGHAEITLPDGAMLVGLNDSGPRIG